MTIEPTNEACKEFRRVYNKTHVSPEAQIRASLTAAFATQFPPVEKHAELINQLRAIDEERLNNEPYSCEQLCKNAADALEALCARLAPAPVDDEALVEAMAKAAWESNCSLDWDVKAPPIVKEQYLFEVRAALAVARPVIEAAERERCAKVAEHLNGWGSDCGKEGHAVHIAAAIRSGE